MTESLSLATPAAAAPSPQAPANGSAPGPTGSNGTGASGSGDPPFLDSLAPEYRGDPVFKNFKDVGDLAKSYRNAVSKLGVPPDQMLRLPQDEKGDWSPIYKALGRPDDPKGYDFGTIKDEKGQELKADERLTSRFRQEAFAHGLSQKAAKAIFDGLVAEELAMNSERQQKASQAAQANATALRGEWGKDYDKNLAEARQGFAGMFSQPMQERIAKAGLDSAPEFVKAMRGAAKLFREDQLLGGAGSGSQPNRDLRSIEAEQSKVSKALMGMNPLHADYKATKARFEQLLREGAQMKNQRGDLS